MRQKNQFCPHFSTIWPKIEETIFLDKNQHKALLISHEQIFALVHSAKTWHEHEFSFKTSLSNVFRCIALDH